MELWNINDLKRQQFNLKYGACCDVLSYCYTGCFSQKTPYRLFGLLYHLRVIWNTFLSFYLYKLVLCQRLVVSSYGIFIFFSKERSHNIHLLFTHKDVFYYWAWIYEPVLINEYESYNICRLYKFLQCWMKKEDINNLSCIVNLDKTTLLYWLFKAKCCLYCSTREKICKTYRLDKSFKNLHFNL